MTQLLSRAQQVRLVSGQQQWVTYPFALPAGRPDLVVNEEESKLAWKVRLLLAPMEILPSRCACSQPNPFAKDPLHFFKCTASAQPAGIKWWCSISQRSCTGTAARPSWSPAR